MTATTSQETAPSGANGRQRILVLGGGYVGLYTARGLRNGLRNDEAHVTIVDPRPYMTYQPFLPEVAAGSIEPRHVVVSHRRNLKGVEVITGAVTGLRHAERTATVKPQQGDEIEVRYDQVVVALGSVSRVLPIPGLAEQAIGFKTVEEATALRNHVLERLDVAAALPQGPSRVRALTFVFVGGGYAGIEALAELEDLARDAVAQYPEIEQSEVRFVLVEALNRILPEVGEQMGRWTLTQLRARGIDCRLETFLKSCEDGHVVLSDGAEFDTDTIVWTAGVKSNPVLADTDLPLDKMGRLRVRADLRVAGNDGVVEGAWGAGDACAVPDLTKEPGNFCAPNAQHAVRESKQMAKNIIAVLHGEPTVDYSHKYLGSVASLGLGKGVATVYGLKVKGWPAWLMHRAYHGSQIPTFNRKFRVLLDWAGSAVFRRDTVALGRLERPREEFVASAAKPPTPRPAGQSAPGS
ncbi:NAD(P)/FAD-dependent oxidoreductase [Quadrisphaera sp. DSM 44207]|uniref:NAD(P)/FAD-dependent oxidoreductase n=1 Tax=Quadrisphaera sp. DSM 44207 TaxID=1881057 RepID=UPI00088011EA|nr:NAD(P)/FAD-dependent oxidoreductase [Quadrisphaera sp. DSM 44207]SDQ68973.1 NADH dehydrogenase [Quadrisphaera sp. DSM 44207]